MRRWLVVALVATCLGSSAWAKKPKKAPAGPPPEVQEAFEAYGEAAKAFSEAVKATDTYALQGLIWDLGEDGEAFQPQLDALKSAVSTVNERWAAANTAVGTAGASGDAEAIRTEAEALRSEIDGVAGLAERAAALQAELEAAKAALPATVALADLAGTSGTKLQRIFATAGWSKEGAAVGGMATSGYAYENFDVAQGGKVLNVYVIRPDPSATGTGGAKPADVAARAEAGTVFRYHEATDCYVEIRPRDGASADDAKALLAQVITE